MKLSYKGREIGRVGDRFSALSLGKLQVFGKKGTHCHWKAYHQALPMHTRIACQIKMRLFKDRNSGFNTFLRIFLGSQKEHLMRDLTKTAVFRIFLRHNVIITLTFFQVRQITSEFTVGNLFRASRHNVGFGACLFKVRHAHSTSD